MSDRETKWVHNGTHVTAKGLAVSAFRLYICGPMTGLPEFNYPAFNAAASDLRARGHDVLNPADIEAHNDTGKPQEWRWYMRRAIGMVAQADGLAMLPGWENSTGARLEHAIAEALKLDIHPLWWWTV